MFKPMQPGAMEAIVKDLETDKFVKESIRAVPDEVLELLKEADDQFLQGYLAGMSYDMHAMSRIHKAMAEGNVAAAMQLKQFGSTILYLLSRRLLDPALDMQTLKKDEEPEKGKLIIPGE